MCEGDAPHGRPREGPTARAVSVSVLLGSLVLLDLRIRDRVGPAVITGDTDYSGVHPDDLPPVAADLHPVALLHGVAVLSGGGAVLDLGGTYGFPVGDLVPFFLNLRGEVTARACFCSVVAVWYPCSRS